MASTIKVDNIQDQCGTAVITKCGSNKTLAVTTTKSDNYQAADGGNIINQCGTTITIGASGDSITLASGASQTGFGREGTVDWDTTAKTASFTAVSGNGYFINTTSSAITVTLPASPSAGDIVAVKDYAATFATNNCTIGRNSSNIGGVGSDLILDTDESSKTFVYVDGTQGWLVVNDATASGRQALFVAATGGTITTSGDYKIHKFTGPGTFCVSCAGNPLGSSTVDYLVVAGAAGAGNNFSGGATSAGGGGAGGFRASSGTASGCYCAGPGPLTSPVSALPVSASPYPITVGGGGAGGTYTGAVGRSGTAGSNSIFSTVTSAGGGTGGGVDHNGGSGGSGGGAGPYGGGSRCGGAGNTPPVSPPQGNNGAGTPSPGPGGGGGGAGGAASGTSRGPGVSSTITGTPTTYSLGGDGGGPVPSGSNQQGGSPANSGQGGNRNGGAGGSGIVVIRYKFQ